MELQLNNGDIINYNFNQKTIFFGPNSIGKTQICKALKKYYEENNINVLLFDDNILENMITENQNENNSFEIMPKVQEYNKYNNNIAELKIKLKFKEAVKKICGVDTKTAFNNFDILKSYIESDVYTYSGIVDNPIFNSDELKILFKKPGTGLLNFFDMIDGIIKEDISIFPENIINMVAKDIYDIQIEIVQNKEKYIECPVCYAKITDESIVKIKENIKNGSLDDKLKQSLLFYINYKNEKINGTIISFLKSESYLNYKNNLIKQVENDVLYYLDEIYDSNDIKLYLENQNNLNLIVDQIRNFRLKDNDEIYNYIKEKLKCHSIFKNSSFDVDIDDGKLKISGLNVDINNMSKSEQNFFKFLYFDILVYQKKEEGELHIIVDDPFDSYDDIYVQDSINIIKNLIEESIDKIDGFNIFSHSLYSIHLYNETNNNFKIKWLDKFKNSNLISVYNDTYKLFDKIDINPYDYALILKISDKLIDKYSLVAFASLLRNEIEIERQLLKNNSNNENDYLKSKINFLYDTISETVNHCKQNITINQLSDMINSLFYYNLHNRTDETIDEVLNGITSSIDDVDIMTISGSQNEKIVLKDDICYILIYKYLLGLKIRRIFEEKARINANKFDYRNIGELIPYITDPNIRLFYDSYNFVINSFNHISAKLVPPTFIYTTSALQKCYDELSNL